VTVRHLTGSLLLLGMMSFLVLVGTAAAEDGTGTLRGIVTMVGDDPITDGELVVSLAGTNTSAATALFSSEDPDFSIPLAPGDYTVYAWAKVYHNSARTAFSIEANATTWVNLTVVRYEEVIGTVKGPKGEAIPGAVLQFRVDGKINGTLISDDNGQFRDLLDPGTYRVLVTKAGYHELEQELTVAPGQVLLLDLVIEPVPEDEEDEPFPLYTAMIMLFVLMALGLSWGYMMSHARKLRRAARDAEAARTRDMECPKCGHRVPEGDGTCPECSHVFQVRCDECGRSMDMGTEECPECGHPMS